MAVHVIDATIFGGFDDMYFDVVTHDNGNATDFGEQVAQPLLAVRICGLRLRRRFRCACKNRTGKSACATGSETR
jgi:hypothetical protein